jgi:hypothetical protein
VATTVNYHTRIYQRDGRNHTLLRLENDTRHVSFPTAVWAEFQPYADERYPFVEYFWRVEDCTCDPQQTIAATTYMSVRPPVVHHGPEYGRNAYGSRSSGGGLAHLREQNRERRSS